MQSIDTLNLLPVWVNPDHLAMTAKIILAGHRLKVLGVVEGHELVGIITAADTNSRPDGAHVRDFMTPPDRLIDAGTPLRDVAETFWLEDLDYLPVVKKDRFRGIVTPNMLLQELARSWDPLTGLTWSDSLREWGVEQLKEGREITILFIDLDDFGNYNKRFGHIVGDRVLQRVAEMIEERMDPQNDLLVRYGGDEFAVGTRRGQSEALSLADELQSAMRRIRVAGSDERVTFCIGVQGGKRTKERENVHFAATLDNLINLASKACMAQKGQAKKIAETNDPAPEASAIAEPDEEQPTPETDPNLSTSNPAPAELEEAPEPEEVVEIEVEAPKPVPAPEGGYRVAEVVADAADANSVTQVVIEEDGTRFTGVSPRKGGSVVKSVALATANAILQAHPDIELEIREVNLTESESGVRFISVMGTSRVGGDAQPVGGIATVGRDLYQTVAEAALQAYVNLVALQRGLE